MDIRILNSNEEKEKIEILRKEVFNLKNNQTYYLDELLNNKLYSLGVLDNSNIIGGCYFHKFNDHLIVDQIFVKNEYQNNGIGSNLIKTILLNKDKFEDLLGGELNICEIEALNKGARNLYIKMGFKERKMDEDMMYKRR